MDDSLLVRGLERLGDLPGDRERLLQRQRSDVLSDRPASTPSTSSSTKRPFPVGLFDPVDRADVRVIEGREHPRFALEPRQRVRDRS